MQTKAHEMSHLRELALPVLRPNAGASGLSARQAALCLSGVTGLLATKTSLGTMQQACRDLVAFEPAWSSNFGILPTSYDGRVVQGVELLAIAARGILTLAGVENTRAALAFWASERDPAIWASLAE